MATNQATTLALYDVTSSPRTPGSICGWREERGTYVWDEDGKRYLDFGAGIRP